jgi:hypothetical protein
MSKQASKIYASNIEEIANAVLVGGPKRTLLVEGDMGSGKSSIQTILKSVLPSDDWVFPYLDCATLDLGDMYLPNIMDVQQRIADNLKVDDTNGNSIPYVTFAPNENFGLHTGKKICLMLDELGKANPSVKNALLRVMHPEQDGLRHLGKLSFPEGSIVFATTNLSAEGVGDIFLPHQSDRMTTLRMRKPTADEWCAWGINNDVEAAVLGYVKDTPQVMQSFDDVANPDDNPYIYHPQAQRAAFVTPRGLEACSDWLKCRAEIDSKTLTGLLIGTVGEAAAMGLMTYVTMEDQLPSLDDIKDSPDTAKIPRSAAAMCMVVYRTLAVIDRSWINAWMTYLVRIDAEAQGLFANGVRVPNYKHQSLVMTNKAFTAWSISNRHMFATDKV